MGDCCLCPSNVRVGASLGSLLEGTVINVGVLGLVVGFARVPSGSDWLGFGAC